MLHTTDLIPMNYCVQQKESTKS